MKIPQVTYFLPEFVAEISQNLGCLIFKACKIGSTKVSESLQKPKYKDFYVLEKESSHCWNQGSVSNFGIKIAPNGSFATSWHESLHISTTWSVEK